MSDSDGRREEIARQRQLVRDKAEKIKGICGAIVVLDREISEHDAKVNTKRTERDRLQAELERLVGDRY